MERTWNRQRESMARRQGAINEIHFTHVHLARLLRAMAARDANGPIGGLLGAQYAHEQQALRATIALALDLGLPPGPCVCAEGDALVEAVYHADRIPRADTSRSVRIVECLRDVRRFTLGLWSIMANELQHEPDEREVYRLLLSLQGAEADRHRELVSAATNMQSGDGRSDFMRSA